MRFTLAVGEQFHE